MNSKIILIFIVCIIFVTIITGSFNTDDIFVHESRDGSKYLAIDCSVCHCIIILGDVQ